MKSMHTFMWCLLISSCSPQIPRDDKIRIVAIVLPWATNVTHPLIQYLRIITESWLGFNPSYSVHTAINLWSVAYGFLCPVKIWMNCPCISWWWFKRRINTSGPEWQITRNHASINVSYIACKILLVLASSWVAWNTRYIFLMMSNWVQYALQQVLSPPAVHQGTSVNRRETVYLH